MNNVNEWVSKSVNDVMAAYGLPADAVFLGYVVWRRDSDEFLVSSQKFPKRWHVDGAARLWTPHPAMAKIFKDHRAAASVANDCGNGDPEVVHLFDTADQLFVAFDG